MEDRSSAQKTNADHDVGGDPSHVGADDAVVDVMLVEDELGGDDHERRRRQRDQHMGAQSRRLPAHLALVADRTSQEDRGQEPQEQFQEGNWHEPAPYRRGWRSRLDLKHDLAYVRRRAPR